MHRHAAAPGAGQRRLIDEDVVAVILLSDLGLDDNGKPIPVNPAGPEPHEPVHDQAPHEHQTPG